MNRKMTTKEAVIIAMVGAVIGVVYTLMDYAYMSLAAILGTVFMELTFGIYLLSASLPMYLVRKPGAAIYGALVTAGVNLLLGSPYGVQLVLAGTLQAVGIEIGYRFFGGYQGNLMNMVIGAILGALLVFSRDAIFFGTFSYGMPIVAGIIAVRLLSASLLGILLVKLIAVTLQKTGVLKGFACVK